MSKKRLKQANSQAQKLQKLSKPHDVISQSSALSEFDWHLMDEYDPMAPNSYEILQLEFIKSQEQKRNESRSSGKIDPSVLDVLDRLDEEEDHLDNRTNRGTAIAPPSTLQTTHAQSNSTSSNDLDTLFTNLPKPSEKLDGTSAAAKIMAKMGYKLGQGLGRDGQGISSPLEVEKSGGSAGRIVHRPRSPSPPEKLPNLESPEPTRVLLLQNMVGPGEVDDDLELETKMECAKYGEVVKCLIFELPNRLVPDDQAVRIFIEFKSTESAQKAANDLNGRYFGGRVVKASFYDVDKFNKLELGP